MSVFCCFTGRWNKKWLIRNTWTARVLSNYHHILTLTPNRILFWCCASSCSPPVVTVLFFSCSLSSISVEFWLENDEWVTEKANGWGILTTPWVSLDDDGRHWRGRGKKGRKKWKVSNRTLSWLSSHAEKRVFKVFICQILFRMTSRSTRAKIVRTVESGDIIWWNWRDESMWARY